MSPNARIAFIAVRCIAAALVFYAIGNHPYNVYTFTRWVVFLTCCWGLWQGYRRMWLSFAPVYGVVGILFNPLVPFHFQRSTWRVLDVAVGVSLVLSLVLESRVAKPR